MIFNHETTIVSGTSRHTIFSDTNDFFLVYSPTDLVDKTDTSLTVFSGLERVYEKRKNLFLENLRCIADFRSHNDLGNVLPDYSEISEKDGILYARSRYYDAELLTVSDDEYVLFRKVAVLCTLVVKLVQQTGYEPVLHLEDVVFERNDPGQLHVLHLDLLSKETNPLSEQLRHLLTQKYYRRKPAFHDQLTSKAIEWLPGHHPQFSVHLDALLHSLLPVGHTPQSWEKAKELSVEICNLLEQSPDFLLHPYRLKHHTHHPLCQNVMNAFASGQHIVFLCGDDMKQLHAIADSYLFCAGTGYLHTAIGNAAEGLEHMLECEAFAVASGAVTARERYAALLKMCSEKLLLILENCAWEQDAWFRKILRLPADILLLTHDDPSEYGFFAIRS